ncbi:MAG: choice-of-anchor D domain-containing protein [Acidobacteriota bacterium]
MVLISSAIGQTASSSNINFGTVPLGSTLIKAIAITNATKFNLTISQASVSGSGFSFAGPTLPVTLAPQKSANVSVSFAPKAAGTDSGSLIVTSYVHNSNQNHTYTTAVSLSGNGANAAFLSAVSSMNLGTIATGSSISQGLKVSNTGGSSLTISSENVSGTGFSVSGLTFPYTLAAGASATLSVMFAPTVAGSDTAILTINSNASDPSVAVTLSATATSSTSTIGISPVSMSFGSITIGNSQSQQGTIIASGGSVAISSASSSNSAFTVSGITLPLTIVAGQSVPFTVTFKPTVSGTISGKISFLNSGSVLASESMTGTGITIQHAVDLSWNASTSTFISGYNVYRSAASGGPYTKINSSLNPSMNYSDGTVQSGRTYYYVTTAVSSSGTESAYSNQVTVVVPFP